MQDRKKDTAVYNGLLDSEGEGGMIWEKGILTCILSCKNRITSLCLMQDTACLGLVHGDDPEECCGEGGGRGVRFLHDSIHVSMPFSQIIPPAPSPSESKGPLYTSVSFLLSCIQGRHCHLSKFHIYALVYCIGVFLSGLLHSV